MNHFCDFFHSTRFITFEQHGKLSLTYSGDSDRNPHSLGSCLLQQIYSAVEKQKQQSMRRYSRYQESPLQQSVYDLKSKQLVNASTFVTPTAAKNPELELLRLPHLNSMRRSSSVLSTERNTKFKLTTIQDKVEELAADVHNTRLDAQETRSHISFLTDSLVVNQLARLREDLKKQIRGLQRFAKGIQAADQDRSRTIKQDCANLWKQTEELHQNLFQLRMRAQGLQESMGFSDKQRQ